MLSSTSALSVLSGLMKMVSLYSKKVLKVPLSLLRGKVWKEAFIYALDLENIGISKTWEKEWGSNSAFYGWIPSCRAKDGELVIEIPEKFRRFYRLEERKVTVSILGKDSDLILLTITRQRSRRKQSVKRFRVGNRYRLLSDFNDIIYGLVKKGTILTYTGKNLGYAKFKLEGAKEIGIPPKLAFNLLEEVASSEKM